MIRTTLLLLSCLLVSITSNVIAMPDWQDELTKQIKTTYTVTETGMDRLRITKPGTVFTVQLEGIAADPSSDATFSQNKFREGEIKQSKGIVPFLQDKKRTRNLRPGERVYLFKADVRDNEINLYVITCDLFDVNIKGSTQQVRYKSLVTVQFPKDFLATAEFGKVKGVIETLFAPETGVTSAGPKSIELGQTPAQVEEAIGKPEKIIKLGEKTIYVYKDMKVTFINGRLTDVQ
jgi:hypothetical protein